MGEKEKDNKMKFGSEEIFNLSVFAFLF